MDPTTIMAVTGALLFGAAVWTLAEYVLHRFAMHALGGKGIMSREHLEHHVTSSWSFDPVILLAWAGIFLVGCAVWIPLTRLAGASWPVAASVADGWGVGYFFYEFFHARAHLVPPTGTYSTWLRRHHFHHHFGHPMANHGVSVSWWDHAFGTFEHPDRVRVPRRLALPWMVDGRNELRAEFTDDYVLVGRATTDDRTAALDRARAFASTAPAD